MQKRQAFSAPPSGKISCASSSSDAMKSVENGCTLRLRLPTLNSLCTVQGSAPRWIRADTARARIGRWSTARACSDSARLEFQPVDANEPVPGVTARRNIGAKLSVAPASAPRLRPAQKRVLGLARSGRRRSGRRPLPCPAERGRQWPPALSPTSTLSRHSASFDTGPHRRATARSTAMDPAIHGAVALTQTG